MSQPRVAIIMGSASDKSTMQACADMLGRFEVDFEWRIMSAHRTPAITQEYVSSAASRGIQVVICGAGMAAHLAGAAAAHTTLPVIGVPIPATLDGMDALLATVQMPPGMPVATVAIGRAGATNAAILAVQILALHDARLAQALLDERAAKRAKIAAADAELSAG